jgi:hypothetical protein
VKAGGGVHARIVLLSLAVALLLAGATQVEFHTAVLSALAAVFFGAVTLITLAFTPGDRS